jgi:integrase
VQWLTDDEVSALLSTASTDQRSLSLCWLALHGLRVGEIAGLNVEQYQDGILWNVAGKGGKTRNIPLAADAVAALTAYIGQRRSGALFLGAQGRLRHRRIQALVYTLTETIGHRVSIHALRHTYGTKAVRRGVQTLLLSKLMGHESPITTGKYVHLNTDDVRPVNDLVYPKQGLKVIDGQKEAI